LREVLAQFEQVTKHLLTFAAAGENEAFLADATLYMELFGILNVAWHWLKIGTVAQQKLATKSLNIDFYQSKIHTMKFYYTYEVTKIDYLSKVLMGNEKLTPMGETEVILQ
jgi:butyryl-CoA dehydrogenase